jgi:probable HAF family extracellular repeat protein
MRTKSFKRGLLAAGVLLACASQASATSYTFTDLGTLGGPYTGAYAINNAGQAVGYSYTTYAAGYNRHATLWNNGSTATDLGTLGGVLSNASAINNAGQVVGWSNTPRYATSHATLWNGSIATDLGTLGGINSFANAINNAGQVAGYSYTAGDAAQHATLWNGSTVIDLGTLGGSYSQAMAINNAGQVAGVSNTADDEAARHATLWNGTSATDVNSFLDASTVSAGWILTSANGINDNGWIVGAAQNSITGQTHAFLLTPVPEPETYAMLLAGLGLIGSVARRRKAA